MFAVLRWLVTRIAVLGWATRIVGSFALFLPLVFLLKLVGLPVLFVLGIVGLPLLFVLFLFGLPVIMVLVVGGLMMGVLAFALSIGMFAFKIFLFVVLPIWVVTRIVRWLMRAMGKGGETPAAGPVHDAPATGAA